MKKLILLLAIGYWLLAVPPALAFFPTAGSGGGLAPISEDLRKEILGVGQQAALIGIGSEVLDDIDVRLFAMRIVRVALSIVGITLIAMLLYGGALYMTSQGNDEKVTQAQKVLARAGVGTLIIIFSYGIAVFVARNLQKAIYQQHLAQAQSCGTGGTSQQVTCCEEWNAYQAAVQDAGLFADLGGAAAGTGAAAFPGPTLESETEAFAESVRQREAAVGPAYDKWQECFEKAQEEAFSFGD